MSEWWTYTLSDFLLFSPGTYYRLFELYNAAIWPAQVLAVALGLAMLLLLRRKTMAAGRVITAVLAACWLWVAIAFLFVRYATINWAAIYFTAGFVLQGALLMWVGVIRGRLSFRPPTDAISRAGLGMFLFALVAQPLIGPLLGRDWRQIEMFGVAPDPTAVGTLGMLLVPAGRTRWEILFLPLLWCAVSGATLWAMQASDAWVMPTAAVLAVLLGVRKTRPAAP